MSPANVSPSQGRLQIIEIVSESEFLGLEEAWNDIAREARPRSIFFQHEWFAAAWAWRRHDALLHMLIGCRGNSVVGILPLIRRVDPPSRIVEYELLTIPDTQLADMLCAPADADEIVNAFAAALGSDRRWDTLRLDLLSPDGPCIKSFIQALRRHGLHVVQRDSGRNLFVDLSDSWPRYYETRSRSLKKAINLAANRIQGLGDVRVECISGKTRDHSRLAAALETIIEISARSWKRETGNSLDQPGPQAFIRSLSQRAFERDWLAIWLLHVGGKPLAVEYDLVFEGRVHALRADFDAVCKNISPGTHLFRVQLEQLFRRGFTRYYMGRGENTYKLRWTDQGDSLRRLLAYNRTAMGRVTWVLEEIIKPVVRRTRDALWSSEKTRAQTTDKKAISRSAFAAGSNIVNDANG
jgi:CelD/BcsL family acetyltransferase involved in cellulose biosynthesis